MSSTDATVIGGAESPPADAPAIDGVVIERELGRGGMGAVWLGRQTYLDRQVAVKALTLRGDEAFAARFRREARILAGLAHPHIVACHQAGMAPDGRPFLVMEFVDGPDLKKHVAAHGPLPPAEAARLTAEIAEGLRHAHAQGIIHRDVKPENVLLARKPDGTLTAKLADLGLARPSQAAKGGTELTAAGQVLGTPSTMAPEQFDDPDAVDQRADIYGLGCVLHHALTGEPAFLGRSFAELVASKVNGPAPDPARRRPGLPPALSALCMRMLDRDRSKRPDYDALIAALRAPHASPRPRWPWLLAGALAAGLLVVAVLPASAGQAQPAAPIAAPAPTSVPTPPPAPATVRPAEPAPPPAASGLSPLTAPLDLFGQTFETRLAGWSIGDPLAWGVAEDVDGFPVGGRSGEILRPLSALPGRITGTVVIPTGARRVLLGVRDADGRTTGLQFLPLNGIIASLVARDAAGGETAAGSATQSDLRVAFSLALAGNRLTASLPAAAVADPLVIPLPASPVAIVLQADAATPVLFTELRAAP